MAQFRYSEWGVKTELVTADIVYFTPHHVVFSNNAVREGGMPKIVLAILANKVHDLREVDEPTDPVGVFSPTSAFVPDLQESR